MWTTFAFTKGQSDTARWHFVANYVRMTPKPVEAKFLMQAKDRLQEEVCQRAVTAMVITTSHRAGVQLLSVSRKAHVELLD
jgi:hypothetical protein